MDHGPSLDDVIIQNYLNTWMLKILHYKDKPHLLPNEVRGLLSEKRMFSNIFHDQKKNARGVIRKWRKASYCEL